MDDSTWLLAIAAIVWVLYILGRRWYRQRIAAKSADQLLAEVLKYKDAFRR